MLGLAELVALGGNDPAVRRYGELIRDSGSRLQQLLQALLDLAQLGPRAPPDPQSCDLAELLASIAACHATTLQRQGLELTLRPEAGLPRLVRMDRPRVAFLLHMLIRDAIGRARAPCALTLSAANDGGGIRIVVQQQPGRLPAPGAPPADGTAWDAGVAERLLGEVGGRQLPGGPAGRALWLPATPRSG
ncbi:MAG TPA: hypothetical protein VGE20_18955 [Ramlibacter sp.]